MSTFTFNANEAPEPVDYTPLPVGTEAPAQITASELGAANQKGTQQLKLTFKILDGDFKGREINHWYTVVCPTSEKAVEIGQRSLREICEAMNIAGFTQTEELHDKPMLVKFGQEKPNDKGNIFNNVRSVKGLAAAPVANTATTQQSAGAPAWAK